MLLPYRAGVVKCMLCMVTIHHKILDSVSYAALLVCIDSYAYLCIVFYMHTYVDIALVIPTYSHLSLPT